MNLITLKDIVTIDKSVIEAKKHTILNLSCHVLFTDEPNEN
jgi:hypothetical protein